MGCENTRAVVPGPAVPSIAGMTAECAASNVKARIDGAAGRNRYHVFIDPKGGLRVLPGYSQVPARVAAGTRIGTFNRNTPIAAIEQAFREKMA